MLVNYLLDPNVAYVVLVLAFVIMILAILAPGTRVLELVALSLMVAVGIGVANNPVNTWAFPFLLAGIILVFVTIRRNSLWYFLGMAIACLVIGTAFLYKGNGGMFAADPLLVVLISACLGSFIWIIGHYTRKASNQKTTRDLSHLIGMSGKAITDIDGSGSVRVNSEAWSAVSDKKIISGSMIKVVNRNGLVLKVEKSENQEKM